MDQGGSIKIGRQIFFSILSTFWEKLLNHNDIRLYGCRLRAIYGLIWLEKI